MNKIKLIASVLALVASCMGSSALFACGYDSPFPEDYYVYRISENYLKKVEVDPAYLPGSNENCLLWMEQLGAETIGPEEVYEIVYKADLDSLASLSEYNAFASILLRHPEALKMLRLAKECEKARFQVTGDPWYYPVEGDSVRTTLQDIVARARAYGDGIFRSRYFLQEVRALFTLGRFEEIVSRWEAVKDSLPEDILKQLTVRYVAGAHYNLDDEDKAVEMFLSVGDLTSALSCKNLNGAYELDAVVDLDVNYPGIRSLLEQEIRAICIEGRGGEDWKSERLDEIRALCDRALEKGAQDKALWYYTAAYIDYFNERFPAAKRSLKLARKFAPGDELLEGSVRVLGILLDAKTSRHNIFYERRLLRDLKWLDSQIVANLTDELKERTAEDYGWMLRSNFSYYYWNDMMRLLTVGILSPAYVKEGKTTRALEMANMADNRLLALTGVTEYSWQGGYTQKNIPLAEYIKKEDVWKADYSNDFFQMADSLGAKDMIRYAGRVRHPRFELDRFLISRGNNDPDYLADLVGTLLIRERRYDEAVTWLEKLPADFQNRLNTSGYLDGSGTVKLDHAREMVALQHRMKSKGDASDAAAARWEFGQRMMRQYTDDWALSYYFKTAWPDEYVRRGIEEGTSLASVHIKEGMASMPDPEYAAKMQYAMCNYRTVMESYPDTEAGGWVRSFCDTWEDYHRENPENWF